MIVYSSRRYFTSAIFTSIYFLFFNNAAARPEGGRPLAIAVILKFGHGSLAWRMRAKAGGTGGWIASG